MWTREINNNYSFEYIDILNVMHDGIINRYEAVPKDGYVMYDTTDKSVEKNPDTGEEMTVVYYYKLCGFPLNFNFNNFTWVSVPISSINEQYIV